MDYETLTYELRDHVAHITLNRPEDANAINLQMAVDLMQVSLATSSDANVRAILLTGTGRFFCAGGDLKSFAAQGDGLPAHMKEVTTFLHGAISRFTRGDAPLIAAINGVAAGAGMSLACSCDIVLAAESARFTMAYTKAGLTPDGSSTYFLPRKVGLRRALELTLLNPMVDAAQAQEYGLVTRVVPDDRLMAEATAAAAEVAAGPHRRPGRDAAAVPQRAGGDAGDADGAGDAGHRAHDDHGRRARGRAGLPGEARADLLRSVEPRRAAATASRTSRRWRGRSRPASPPARSGCPAP